MLLAVGMLVVGFPLIAVAADQFVTGASRLSVLLGISPVVIGAVVVGFGTSAPEMVVGALATVDGVTDLAVTQVLGSNIANLALVLGLAAVVATVHIARHTIRREMALSAAACVLFVVLAATESLSRLTGALLAAVLAVALTAIIRWGRATPEAVIAEAAHLAPPREPGSPVAAGPDDAVAQEQPTPSADDAPRRGPELVRTLVAVVVVVVAAQMIVTGATTVAVELGVSEAVLGFTLVAFGTSLPELVTAVSAARRGHTDLILGNVLGSNLFNSLGVGAVIGLVGPAPLVDVDVVVRTGVAFVALLALVAVFMRTRPGVVRWEGVVLVAAYIGVIAWLFV